MVADGIAVLEIDFSGRLSVSFGKTPDGAARRRVRDREPGRHERRQCTTRAFRSQATGAGRGMVVEERPPVRRGGDVSGSHGRTTGRAFTTNLGPLELNGWSCRGSFSRNFSRRDVPLTGYVVMVAVFEMTCAAADTAVTQRRSAAV
jgi:hypothetical protein